MKRVDTMRYAMKLALRLYAGKITQEKYVELLAKLDTWVLVANFGGEKNVQN